MSILALNLEAVEGAANIVGIELKSVLFELSEELVKEFVTGAKVIIVGLVLGKGL